MHSDSSANGSDIDRRLVNNLHKLMEFKVFCVCLYKITLINNYLIITLIIIYVIMVFGHMYGIYGSGNVGSLRKISIYNSDVDL